MAGIIAANENNREGIVGIAPGAELFAYRACWPTQDASASATCNTLTLAKALSAAIDRKMNIVNLSLSGPSDPLLERIVAVGNGDCLARRMDAYGAGLALAAFMAS